jgi:hypothetical protein
LAGRHDLRGAAGAPGFVVFFFGLVAFGLTLAACAPGAPLHGADPLPPVPPDPPVPPCQQGLPAPQRFLRLTLRQATNAVRGLLGDDVANALVVQLGLDDPASQFFPPLDSPREGDTVTPERLQQTEIIAAAGAQFVFDHFADVVGCDASVDCVRLFIAGFAEKAYRRPLLPAERDSLDQEISDLLAIVSSAQEAAQYGVYAVLMAPQFIYRSELGDPSAATSTATEVALTPYEMASQLSFALTDGPPDAPLLAAAAQGTLASDAGLAQEVTRLLETPAARQNLSNAVSVYFKLNLLANVVIDTARVPAFDQALDDAMATEGRLFLDEVLWRGNSLRDLLTSTTSFVNADLATVVYGIPAPAGATATDFVRVALPGDQRAGLLSRAAFITARARPDLGDLVARGLLIGETAACETVPSPPGSIVAEEAAISQSSITWSQRARAEQRLALANCVSCHVRIDSYGLPLESYDIIGRYRTSDDQGQPIDPSATLPASFDNQPVRDAVDLSQKIARSHTFIRCLTKSFLQYALADLGSAPVALDSCAVTTTAARFAASPDQSFSAFIKEVVLSPAVARRRVPN